ncbi:MAG: LptF/LptG family permease [Prochlorothrix sp.]|nr:LptF/LptG family permease [Prochlorothrix sp.]
MFFKSPLPILDRYLLREMSGPFFFGVAAFTSVGISIGILFDLIRRVSEAGLPLTIAFQVFALKMPEFIVLAFPMSMLLAALMTYSRLSTDSELVALRSCGISVYRLLLPAVVLSIGVTGLTFLFNESLVPLANYQATVTLDTALENDRLEFQERNILYQQYAEITQPDGSTSNGLARIFYARRFDGEQMQGVTILDFSRGELNQILAAKAAQWNPQESVWDFYNGTLYLVAPDGSYRSILNFGEHSLAIPKTPLDLASRSKDYGEMNILEAQAQLKLLETTGNEQDVRKLRVRLQQKWAFPFVCVVFGLVGSSLGILPNQRTNRATAFGFSVLIIFGYYLLAFVFSALGVRGSISPFLAAWMPIFLSLVVGGGLALRASR